MGRRKTAFFAATALALAAGGASALWLTDFGAGRADPDDPKQVALGRDIYAVQCASCHGAKLEGQPDWQTRKPDGRLPAPPHDAQGHTWHHADQDLFGIIKNGIAAYAPPGYESDMPAFQGVLSDQQIWATLAFIKSRWPDSIRRQHDSRKNTK
jgi:mono/diheme cytochrome c family protein